MTARLNTALLAASFLGVLTGAAAADPATVVSTSNLRAGPGVEYPIRVTIPGGATIDVQDCDGNWCVARYAGYEGYVSQSLVAGSGASGPAVAVIPDDDYSYDEGPSYGYGYAPSYGYYGRDHRPRVHRDWQNNNRGNWQGQRNWQQTNRSYGQGSRGGNWQRNTGQPTSVGVQPRSQQNFRATAPRAPSQPAAGGGAGGRAVTQGKTGPFGQ